MENTPIKTNNIILEGEICSAFEISHEVYGEKFYSFYIENKRLSNASDILPVIISERLLTGVSFTKGDNVRIDGQIRSFNSNDGIKTHLMLNVFAKNIENLPCNYEGNENCVMLNGYICKAPIYRTTPFGRKIADMLLAVNRAYGKSDYIPTICWGRNARFVTSLAIGTNIAVYGRMQSREYQKKLENDEYITKTAYEVSISKLEQISAD
jgi:primosomal replication protein N